MFLYEAFPPEFIKIGLEAEDKDEVFEELVDVFCHVEKSDRREEILSSVRERESKMSTGIKKGIAVPHGRSNVIKRTQGLLGISKKGIDYDALDGQPVYLVFMFVAPQVSSEKHLRLLKRLATLLDNPQFHTDILAQSDPRSVNAIIKKYEDIYIATEWDREGE